MTPYYDQDDRESLAAALEEAEARARRGTTVMGIPEPIETAARERLAQLPEPCGYCENTVSKTIEDCDICGNKGTLYPSALVERIAQAMRRADATQALDEDAFWQVLAVAVLDDFNTETP